VSGQYLVAPRVGLDLPLYLHTSLLEAQIEAADT